MEWYSAEEEILHQCEEIVDSHYFHTESHHLQRTLIQHSTLLIVSHNEQRVSLRSTLVCSAASRLP